MLFYERNPARRILDFKESEDTKFDFLRYAVDFHCRNPIVADIKRHPLPQLENLVEGMQRQILD